MERFICLDQEELKEYNGGGIVAMGAGAAAGAMIGAFAGLIPTAATGNTKYIKDSTIAGAALGAWGGLGCPIP